MGMLDTVLNCLLGAPGQRSRLLRLHTPLGGEVLVAETLSGEERVDGNGYRFELTALSVDAGLDLASLLGQPVLLELQTAESSSQPRPLHGQVSAAELIGSNGGLARYRLLIEPWLSLLGQRVDSYVFQDMDVVEIVESVFADYAEQGAIAPAWRWELSDRSVYRKRSLATQYQESDLAFVQRLLAEEGIGYWFEHEADAEGETLGKHTLVLSDHNDASAELGTVRYHRSDVTEAADSVQQWSHSRRWRTAKLARASWDYRSLDLRPQSAEAQQNEGPSAEDVDTSGPYAWPDAATGQRYARQHLEARQVDANTINGQGSWRQLRPGGRFILSQHTGAGTDPWLCLRVEHRARNNLGAEVFDALEQLLGAVSQAGAALPVALGAQTSPGNADEIPDFYANRFQAIPASVPYRPKTEDGHGLHLHPKPTVQGTQSAIVVSDGEPLLSDRDHRIKVQFAWQRGGDASSGTAHPSEEDNAPGSAQAWTWVRVMTPWAGDNWGTVMLPRKGQEVLVGFLEGDIDRPVVVGSVYNGRGQDDAPHNQVGSGGGGATGNAAAWFEGNDHAAVYTGFKSQALAQSQDGSGGYQQLRLDDSPGQGRAQLSTTQQQSTLTLGHLKGGEDNVREGERGYGAELSTQASGAIRAGQGLLLASESGTRQLDAQQARTQLDQAEELLQSLNDAARNQRAGLDGEADTLPAQASQKTLKESLQATSSGSAADGVAGGEGEAPGWSAPVLLGSGAAGIVSLTPSDQGWVSGTQTVLTANTAINWLSQAQLILATAQGLVLYTQGAEGSGPVTARGIALHAAQGKASARAHRNEAKLAAKTNVKIASTTANVEISAPSKHILATAAGAYIKIEGGNIELGAPGTIEFKATKKEWTSAQSVTGNVPTFGEADPKFCELGAKRADAGGAGVVSLD